ncbi:NUDIX hydrolase [Aurantimonas sp. 22II-16-19i]|uniref:NUDIX hydrolase n=1 Tax=Aurantimonas sp. 22II-16-19i TaxID=1317114 RepID=UPI0009F7E08A|nr:NUDIX hydrolase [Aurantimonas sp. 22II-16-19i]ORE90612.1 hypothetical protein ATO4_21135 [Aurantimonas sp. 22II-16-19i]
MKSKRRRQFAALPFRKRGDAVEVLLITSRETGRWVIPKGWPIRGKAPHAAAAIEAYEEAGVVGKPSKKAIGRYDYAKRTPNGQISCRVIVFALPVEGLTEEWPEMDERRRKWHAANEAADLVEEPDLGAILRAVAEFCA